jgi:hypothetical protein
VSAVFFLAATVLIPLRAWGWGNPWISWEIEYIIMYTAGLRPLRIAKKQKTYFDAGGHTLHLYFGC